MGEIEKIKRELGRYRPLADESQALATPKMLKALMISLPLDCREWFLEELEISPVVFNFTVQRILVWIYKDITKLKLDLSRVERIRKARVELVEEAIQNSLPTQAVMTYLDQNLLSQYEKLGLPEHLVECLMKDLKADRTRLIVAVGLALNSGHIKMADILFMSRITKPVPTIVQSILLDVESDS